MIELRQKLMLGFGGMLALVVLVSSLAMVLIGELGVSIDLILKENYRSVVACQDMKEALERMDSGTLFTLVGNVNEGNQLIAASSARFKQALKIELGNITLPGEQEKAQRLHTLFERYVASLPGVTAAERPVAERKAEYFARMLPLFMEIKEVAQDISLMNQNNMNEANDAARQRVSDAHRLMLAAILIATLIALLFSYLAHRWILGPVNRLIESANEIREGNLDLVVEEPSSGELGRLSESFNQMAAALRHVRNEDHVNLTRTRRATEAVFKALPSAIAVLDLDQRVEMSTETAEQHFGLKPGVRIQDLDFDWLQPLIRKALNDSQYTEADPKTVQQFIENREYFFQPVAVPIPVGPGHLEPTGVAVILKDVTQVHEHQELKRDLVSTVSHQLKTPMTSIRMTLHLLLEGRVGPLTEKQLELLLAAREDSERMVGILDDLLDINRIASGKSHLFVKPVPAHVLVRDAVEPALMDAMDRGIALINTVAAELPEVMADRERIRHVFANLLSNALRFTNAGGSVTIDAQVHGDKLRFQVEDTGKGIPESEIGKLFQKFYRVPGQDEKTGVGLGLAIVKEIISAHGGEVGVQSRLGEGSTFSFSLPLCPPAQGKSSRRSEGSSGL